VRIEPFAPPSNRPRLSTFWIGSQGGTRSGWRHASAPILFLSAMGATLGIGFDEPRVEYGYEFVIFILAACWCLGPRKSVPILPGLALAAISLWGFVQLALGATVYRHASMVGSLRFAALGATAWVSFRILGAECERIRFLRWMAWFGTAIALASVLAYFTSPGKILWTFHAPYPDVWGPFLSRNNFAQFLELVMPVALWFAMREQPPRRMIYLCCSAVMLASGLASASRAGACILLGEAAVMLWLGRRSTVVRRIALQLGIATALCAALPGLGTLGARFTEPDPFQVRREIAHSTAAMIATRPWAGFGLGTFKVVYPEYAQIDVGQSVEHAHNDWLEWAAEGGLGFAALWLGLAIWSTRRGLAAGWGLGVLGCFLHALVDYPFARLGVAAWAFILVGMMAATDLREVRSRGH
jgi:O-antigen ligase